MKKFFKVPFVSKETVILGHTATIEAENAEDAYHTLENVIGNGENPYASVFDCEQNDIIEVLETRRYDIYDIDEVISDITEMKDVKKFLNKTLTDYQKANEVSKSLITVQFHIDDINEEVVNLLDGNADFVNVDSFSWIYNKTTIDQLADREYYDEDNMPSKEALDGMISLKNFMEEKNAVGLCLFS